MLQLTHFLQSRPYKIIVRQALSAVALLFLSQALYAQPTSKLTVRVHEQSTLLPIESATVVLVYGGTSVMGTGLTDATGVVEMDFNTPVSTEEIPTTELLIGSPYPNPFINHSSVPLSLDRPRTITVNVYNPLGKRVAHYEDLLPTGSHAFNVSLSGLSSGVYLFQVVSDGVPQQAQRLVHIANNRSTSNRASIMLGSPAVGIETPVGANKTGSATGTLATYELRVSKEGYEQYSEESTFTGNYERTVYLAETGQDYGTVKGQVYEVGTTTALAGVLVQIGSVTYPTSGDGQYELGNIPTGQQTIEARLEGYHDYSQEITVVEGDNTYEIELTSSIPNTTLHGKVTNSLGQGLQGAWVRVAGLETQASDSGDFTFPSIRQGTYTIEVEHDGYQLFQEQILLFQADIEYDVVLTAVLLDPPTGLQVTHIEGLPGIFNTFEISWDAVFGVSTLKGFNLYRSRDGSPYERIDFNVLPANSTSYRDEGVQTGQYSYQITSVNIDDLEGSPSTTTDPIVALEIDLTLIDSGTFEMGDMTGEGSPDTRPVHTVTISRDFYMGTYEVTQAEWMAVMGSNPSNFTGVGRLPVEEVSWNDAQDFIGVLNDWAGGSYYRLPTEAEWEYAARAGTTTKYSFGDAESDLDNYAWYPGNAGGETHPVGVKQPNPWGLYDVHGNVWEWVNDWWSPSYYGSSPSSDPVGPSSSPLSTRVLRGGSWLFGGASLLRSATRVSDRPANRGSNYGFRLSRMAQ